MFNDIRKQFPILENNTGLVYLDNASTTQKPEVLLDSINAFYSTSNANIHRGMYPLAQKSDILWEQAHSVVAKYINAKKNEVFFVKNATEGLNWIAQTLSEQVLKKDDVVVISDMEHHSNILPWKKLEKFNGIIIESLKILKDLKVDIDQLKELYSKYGERIKAVSVVHMSNVLGSINNVAEIAQISHTYKSLVIVDGTQSIAHMNIDVKNLDCDVFLFSGHKIYGPTGIGVVFAKQELLDRFEPVWQGGEMVDEVKEDTVVFKELPYKFEAGTPNIQGAVGLAKTLEWFETKKVKFEYENELSKYLTKKMCEIDDLEILSIMDSPIFSFNIKGIHPHDIAGELGEKNICVRAGFHCAQPLHERLGVKGSVRVSLGLYNTTEDIDALIDNLKVIFKKYKV